MKGKPEIIKMLNDLLVEIHTGFAASLTYKAMCKKWGYCSLADRFCSMSEEQRKSIEKLLMRIAFLDGSIELQNVNKFPLGENIQKMLLSSRHITMNVVSLCTDGVELSVKLRDYGTRRLVEKILEKADHILSGIEAEITQSKR